MSETVTLEGRVIRKRFGAGSKSDRMAVFLEARDAEYVLRQQRGHAYADPELEQLVGKRVRCTGVITGYTLLVTEWEVLSPR